jgi:hypothetical protein
MDWRPVLARYVWAIAAREALASRRWNGETKTLAVMTIGPVMASLVIGLELVWVLTGRGGRLRHLLAQDVIVVIPFPKRMPAAFAEQLAELRSQATESCEVGPR